jgi:DNA repair protein RecO (recombination protein O)
MTHRISLEPIFVLHTRPYSNTSLIVEMLTMRHGRIAVVARSARGLKSRYRGMLQAFSPLLASWLGHRELKTLGNVEHSGPVYQLEGRALMCGFYLNELLMRLLQRDDPCFNIFNLYQDMLISLEKQNDFRVALRYFEKNLLRELGYALPLKCDAGTGDVIVADRDYQYLPERGFLMCDFPSEGMLIFSGRSLLALQEECLDNEAVLRDAMRLLRMALARHLGNKPIKSREMLV